MDPVDVKETEGAEQVVTIALEATLLDKETNIVASSKRQPNRDRNRNGESES